LSLKAKYKTLTLLRMSAPDEDDWSAPASSLAVVQKFKGLIQVPSNSNLYRNGKDTSNVTGVLFTDTIMNDTILEGDVIQNTGGKKYVISGGQSQPDGVTGIKNHHIELSLEDYDG